MGMTQAKKFKIQKLDRRMNGHHLFSHRIHVYWNDDFLKIRHWFVENFGPGCEGDLFELSQHLNLGYTWAWRSDNYHKEIYLNQEQLSAFVLFNT